MTRWLLLARQAWWRWHHPIGTDELPVVLLVRGKALARHRATLLHCRRADGTNLPFAWSNRAELHKVVAHAALVWRHRIFMHSLPRLPGSDGRGLRRTRFSCWRKSMTGPQMLVFRGSQRVLGARVGPVSIAGGGQCITNINFAILYAIPGGSPVGHPWADTPTDDVEAPAAGVLIAGQ